MVRYVEEGEMGVEVVLGDIQGKKSKTNIFS